MTNRHILMLAVAASAIGSFALAAADNNNTFQADWDSRTASCPAKVTQSTQFTLTVTNINDVVTDFKTGEQVLYTFRGKGVQNSVVPPENPFPVPQTGVEEKAVACPNVNSAQAFKGQLNAIRNALSSNPLITPAPGTSVPLSRSLAVAAGNFDVGAVRDELKTQDCDQYTNGSASDPVVLWVKRLDGTHSRTYTVNIEPNETYTFSIEESWKGKKTGQKMNWVCGETDILSMSIGPLVSTLPSRTYDHQKAPVPPGSSTTEDILVVGNNSNLNVLGAALLNYHFPRIPFLPAWTGFTLSAGPVYQLGNNSPGVSSLGVFFGGSIHLYRSVFLTPGVHVGQFADFPAGFYPGAVIPSSFGDLTPIKRNTAHFAIGLTFKTTTFKKSQQNNGAATNPAPSGGGSGQQQPSGNKTTQPSPGAKGQ